MSLEKDITSVIALLEQGEPVFKPATQANLDRRAEQLRVEEEKRRAAEAKAKQARLRAWKKKMGPELALTLDLIPEVRSAEKQYESVSEDLGGHYGETDDNGFPKAVSFDIKIYGVNVPDDAREKLDKYNLEDRAEHYYQQFLQDQLQMFAEDLMNQFPFINDWFQEGRMGGWLKLTLQSIDTHPEDINTYIDDLDIDSGNIEEWSAKNLRDVRRQMKSYIAQITNRINDLYKIDKRVSKAVRDTNTYSGSKEYWDFFFENCKDDIAEKDAEEATEKSEV